MSLKCFGLGWYRSRGLLPRKHLHIAGLMICTLNGGVDLYSIMANKKEHVHETKNNPQRPSTEWHHGDSTPLGPWMPSIWRNKGGEQVESHPPCDSLFIKKATANIIEHTSCVPVGWVRCANAGGRTDVLMKEENNQTASVIRKWVTLSCNCH